VEPAGGSSAFGGATGGGSAGGTVARSIVKVRVGLVPVFPASSVCLVTAV
jgi:hypothetical protein